jgi:hypothetical protein
MIDLQVFYSTRRAAKYEAENTDAGMIALGRDFAIDAMVKAEHKAAEGDPLAQRVVVQIGSMMPHLINA